MATATVSRRVLVFRVLIISFGFIVVPILLIVMRGLCWESVAWWLVSIAMVLVVVRAPPVIACLVVLMVAVLSVGLLIGWSRVRFHTYDIFGTPERIGYCSRDYATSNEWTKIKPESQGLRTIGVTPAGSAILWSGPLKSCDSGTIWVAGSGQSYLTYGLQGGP